jgi:hypothetical protein
MTTTERVPVDLAEFLNNQKRMGRCKLKICATLHAVGEFLDNNADLNKTFSIVIERDLFKALRREAAHMGASGEQLAKYDEVIKIHEALLVSFKKEDAEA